jgi:hypothetical protein
MYFLDADGGSDDDNPNEGEDEDLDKRSAAFIVLSF